MVYIIFVVVIFAIALLFTSPSKTLKCKKCGFITDDPLRAAGHIALENAHKCEEV